MIAHLEQGLRVPSEGSDLAEICEYLAVPEKYWQPFAAPGYRRRLDFEEALTELVGRPATLRFVDEHADAVADAAIARFFSSPRNETQALDALNSLLVFYGVPPMTPEFFRRYLRVESTKSTAAFISAGSTAISDGGNQALQHLRRSLSLNESVRRFDAPPAAAGAT
jgi:hypothetical protein